MRISPVSNGFNVLGGMTLRMLIFLEGEIVIFLGARKRRCVGSAEIDQKIEFVKEILQATQKVCPG